MKPFCSSTATGSQQSSAWALLMLFRCSFGAWDGAGRERDKWLSTALSCCLCAPGGSVQPRQAKSQPGGLRSSAQPLNLGTKVGPEGRCWQHTHPSAWSRLLCGWASRRHPCRGGTPRCCSAGRARCHLQRRAEGGCGLGVLPAEPPRLCQPPGSRWRAGREYVVWTQGRICCWEPPAMGTGETLGHKTLQSWLGPP